MNTCMLEGKLDRQDMFQRFGKDREQFLDVSKEITNELLRIRNSEHFPDMVMEDNEKSISVYFD